jgi:hypothetical protein
VVPDVDSGVVCTWQWLSAQYHELVVGCVVCAQQIWLPEQPLSKHGINLLVRMQWEQLRQRGPMVETQSTPEKGCGQ